MPENEHWLVTPTSGDSEWVTRDAREAEHLRSDPNCEVQGPFVSAKSAERLRESLRGVLTGRVVLDETEGGQPILLDLSTDPATVVRVDDDR